jgi:hypothetical protein
MSGFELMLPVWVAGALAALLVCIGVIAFRRSVQNGPQGAAWRAGLVAVGVALPLVLLGQSAFHDPAAARRAFEARATELTLRAVAPGSALACLDGVANATIEASCEKALFASPDRIAAAMSYVDARLTLLAEGLRLAAHDPAYSDALERLRRGLEGDRYGFVAHVLETRGCKVDACPSLKLLRDPNRVVANLKERTFDAQVVLHAAAWQGGAPAVAATPGPAVALAPGSPGPGASPNAPVPSKYEFPSAASIPAISIMNPEPAGPPEPPKPAAELKPDAKPPAARPAAPRRPAAAPPGPPTHILPPASPPVAAGPAPAPTVQ